jgi:hypothetical protein
VGVDVIFVHRLLKNPVEAREYVLLSEDLVRGGQLSTRPDLHEVALDLPDIGPVRTYFCDVTDLAEPLPPTAPSWPQRIGATFGMLGRGFRQRVRPALAEPAQARG